MLRSAIRFFSGFLVGFVIAAVLNLLPYWESYGSRERDGAEYIGYPEIIRWRSGWTGVYEFHPDALRFDIAVASAISIAFGLIALMMLPPILRRWGHLFRMRQLWDQISGSVLLRLIAVALGVSLISLLHYLWSYNSGPLAGIFSAGDNIDDPYAARILFQRWQEQREVYLAVCYCSLPIALIVYSWMMRSRARGNGEPDISGSGEPPGPR